MDSEVLYGGRMGKEGGDSVKLIVMPANYSN
jgi:hypothetical protein